MTATVLNFEKDVWSMDAYEVLDHLAYLRRTVARRDQERRELDRSRCSEEQIRALEEVGRSDHEILAKLDAIEESIREQL